MKHTRSVVFMAIVFGITLFAAKPSSAQTSAVTLAAGDLKQYAQLTAQDSETKLLAAELNRNGYSIQNGKGDLAGWQVKYADTDGKTRTAIFILQNYFKAGSTDQAAMAYVTVSGGNQKQTYYMALEAPRGDFENAIKYRIGKNNKTVEHVKAWLKCVTDHTIQNCDSGDAFDVASCVREIRVKSKLSWIKVATCVAYRGRCGILAMICCSCERCDWACY